MLDARAALSRLSAAVAAAPAHGARAVAPTAPRGSTVSEDRVSIVDAARAVLALWDDEYIQMGDSGLSEDIHEVRLAFAMLRGALARRDVALRAMERRGIPGGMSGGRMVRR